MSLLKMGASKGSKKQGLIKSKKDKRKSSMDGPTNFTTPPPGQYANMQSFSVMDDQLDPVTEMARWFCSGMAREEVKRRAVALLDCGKRGEFIVRDKTGAPHCYALTVKDSDTDFLTFLIEKSPDAKKPGYMIRGCGVICATIAKLIKFYRDELRKDLGVQLKNPGQYLLTYQPTVYDTEQKQPEPAPEPVKTKYSKASIDAKARQAAQELEDDSDGSGFGEDWDEGGKASDKEYAQPQSGVPVYNLAKSDNSRGAVAEYDLASNNTGRGPTAEYDLASQGGAAEYSLASSERAQQTGGDQQIGYYDNMGAGGMMSDRGVADDIYRVAEPSNSELASKRLQQIAAPLSVEVNDGEFDGFDGFDDDEDDA